MRWADVIEPEPEFAIVKQIHTDGPTPHDSLIMMRKTSAGIVCCVARHGCGSHQRIQVRHAYESWATRPHRGRAVPTACDTRTRKAAGLNGLSPATATLQESWSSCRVRSERRGAHPRVCRDRVHWMGWRGRRNCGRVCILARPALARRQRQVAAVQSSGVDPGRSVGDHQGRARKAKGGGNSEATQKAAICSLRTHHGTAAWRRQRLKCQAVAQSRLHP